MGQPQAKAGHTRLAISWKRASFGSSARDGQREGRARAGAAPTTARSRLAALGLGGLVAGKFTRVDLPVS